MHIACSFIRGMLVKCKKIWEDAGKMYVLFRRLCSVARTRRWRRQRCDCGDRKLPLEMRAVEAAAKQRKTPPARMEKEAEP